MNKRFNIRKCNADIYRDIMVLLKESMHIVHSKKCPKEEEKKLIKLSILFGVKKLKEGLGA